MSEKYSDGVLDVKFQELQEQMETRFEQLMEQGARIENQTMKTNGSVAKVIQDISDINEKKIPAINYRWAILVGGWAIFTLFVLPAVGITMYKVWSAPHQLTTYEIQQASQQGVQDALVGYQLTR